MDQLINRDCNSEQRQDGDSQREFFQKTSAYFKFRRIAILVGVLFVTTLGYQSAFATDGIRTLDNWQLADANNQVIDFYKDSAGKYSVVLFWATWCPYCRALIPQLEQLRAAHEQDGVNFYALNIWEDGDPVKYAKETGFNFKLLLNADEVAKTYGVQGTPGLYLLNEAHEVVYDRLSGASPEQVVTDIKFVLNQRSQ